MGFFGRFKPARSRALEAVPDGVRVVTDLDRLVSDPVAFRWNGKVHLIKPMDNKTFMGVLNELAAMEALQKSGKVAPDSVLNVYTRLFTTVCDTITRDDVNGMQVAQVHALFREIMACVTGQAHVEEAQKKTPRAKEA